MESGSPSGTATMMIAIAMVKYPTKVEAVVISSKSVEVKTSLNMKKIHYAMKIRKAQVYPHTPSYTAI